MKGLAKGTPIYLKGVCSAEDVKLAKEHGLAVSLIGGFLPAFTKG